MPMPRLSASWERKNKHHNAMCKCSATFWALAGVTRRQGSGSKGARQAQVIMLLQQVLLDMRTQPPPT
jgi:hypothetical protein